ncbi:hypothetical protein CHU32_26155 [Superficieibacter electus]|uniref:Imm33-like domain-containing protein n=1 Tax=Superficieibacter electus TaxID=2022662 RepID=A0A2P5GHH2_9ENTR|nr:hypothetical protein [Superficieibacter electus]POP40664.1 hypothetical protein CHU33_26240 [Superficieibacter electus]POP41828.1 hypothetical protein CHU32_26155 [Superficieibacter electus]
MENKAEVLIKEQKNICRKYNSPNFFCSGVEVIGVAINSMKNQPIYGVRVIRENNSCGWYLWGGDYSSSDDFFQTVHFSHINDVIPDYVIKYLALAPGFKFITDLNGYEDVWYETV